MPNISTDQSRKLTWYVRRGHGKSIFINCTSGGYAYDISGKSFTVPVKRFGSNQTLFTLTEGAGITNGGATGIIELTPTNAQVDLPPAKYFWSLLTDDPDIWLNGDFVILDSLWDANETDEANLQISVGDNTVSLSVNISGSIVLDTGTYSTELRFDSDKEIYQDVTGTSPTFTLAASGNLNGTAILLRLNKPTAVNFPVNFEASSGSVAVDATKLNVFALIYFSNWNGSGAARVIYSNQTFTAI